MKPAIMSDKDQVTFPFGFFRFGSESISRRLRFKQRHLSIDGGSFGVHVDIQSLYVEKQGPDSLSHLVVYESVL